MILEKIKILNEKQQEFLDALKDRYTIVAAFGPTGTGKSLISLAYSIEQLKKNTYSRLIVCRPLIDIVTSKEIRPEALGKIFYEISTEYLKDVLSNYISFKEIKELLNEGKITVTDIYFLRGRTFDNTIIFLDDVQNIPFESIIEVITRLGNNSKLIIAGDPIFQAEDTRNVDSLREILSGEKKAKIIDFSIVDIVRPGAKLGIKLLLEAKIRRRALTEIENKALSISKLHAPDADIITILDLREYKKKHNIKSQHTPDFLFIVKETHLGRIIGRRGERINNVEKELSEELGEDIRIRVLGLTLNLKDIIRAIHPVSWIHKHVISADFVGSYIEITVDKENFGPFVGQKGIYVRFLEDIFKRLLNVGVKIKEGEK